MFYTQTLFSAKDTKLVRVGYEDVKFRSIVVKMEQTRCTRNDSCG